MRTIAAIVLACCASACASAPPVPATARPTAGPTYDQKLSWMLRLEDERVLRDPAPPVPEPPPVEPPRPGQKPGVALPNITASAAPPLVPDLVRLLGDGAARSRSGASAFEKAWRRSSKRSPIPTRKFARWRPSHSAFLAIAPRATC